MMSFILLIAGVSVIYLMYVIISIPLPNMAAKQFEQESDTDLSTEDIQKVIKHYSTLAELYEMYNLRKRHLFVACIYFTLNIGTVVWLYMYNQFPLELQVLTSMVIAAMVVTCNNIRLQNNRILTIMYQ